MKMEIFRAGTHTDGAGNTRAYTNADLDKIAASYNPTVHEAPVVIGHPKDNSPAWGWVKSLQRQGSALFAELKDLVPEFVTCVKNGMYKKRSIALYPDMSLRHVGFLGGMPPAVKGLADIAFAANDNSTVIEFMDCEQANVYQRIGRMFSGLRDYFIEKFGMDIADKVLPSWDIDGLKAIQANDDTNPVSPSFSEGGSMPTVEELQGQLAAKTAEVATQAKTITDLQAKVGQFSESSTAQATEIVALKTENATLKTTMANTEATARKTEHLAFCENLVKEGRLAPALKDTMIAQLEIAHHASTGTFAEGVAKPVDALRAALAVAPKILQFAEVATAAAAGGMSGKAGEQLGALATAKLQQEGNRERSYAWAFAEAQKERPDLALAYESEVRG